MGRIVATIFYIDEDLLQKFDEACKQLKLRVTRSAILNFLILKFLIDNGYEADFAVLEYEHLIEQLYRRIQRRKARKRRFFKVK